MKKQQAIATFILPITLLNCGTIVSFAEGNSDNKNDNLEISEINRTETETSLVIKSKDIKSIRLPNGNWISTDNATYTVNRNGTYDFIAKTKDGDLITSSYTVKELRKRILVTNTPNVRLRLNSEDMLSGMGYMKFKNESTGAWTNYETYRTTKDWTLDTKEGLKSVYVTYKDIAGNETTAIYDQIYLDLSGPEINKFVINNDEPYTKHRNVTLTVSAIDNFSEVDHLLISNDNVNWTKVPYTQSIPWTLTPGAGNKRVYLKAVDSLGNVSETVTDDIFFDDVLPFGTIKINNGASLTNSRNVKLQLDFGDLHAGVKRVTIYEKDKSYTFPTVPSSPTEIDWTLSMGVTGMVSMEVEDMAGNIYRTNSNTITIATLEVTQFRLTEVVNPLTFPTSNPFRPLTWDFPPQKMLSGANIGFDINYKLDLDDKTTSIVNSQYVIEVVGDGYYKKIEMPYDNTIYNGFKTTVTIPNDAPSGAKVYVSSKLTATLTSSGETFTNEAYFPAKGEKALIGVIEGNIKESVKFNEIS